VPWQNSRLGVLAWGLFQAFAYLVLALPSLVIIGASLNPGSVLTFPPHGLTLAWYLRAADTPAFTDSFLLSVELASAATALSLIAGTPAAYALQRYRLPGLQSVQALLLSPLVIPAIVLGIGLLMFCNLIGVGQGLIALLLGHFVLTLPYVVRTLVASFSLFDVVLEEAAQSLRASRFVTWYRVILPNIVPGLLSAAIFSFVTSFGNVALSIFLVSGSVATLPVQMFAAVEHSSDPTLAAVASFVIFITGIIVLTIDRLAGLQRLV
jgi:putative spermidine/putrescine transport system permease protein